MDIQNLTNLWAIWFDIWWKLAIVWVTFRVVFPWIGGVLYKIPGVYVLASAPGTALLFITLMQIWFAAAVWFHASERTADIATAIVAVIGVFILVLRVHLHGTSEPYTMQYYKGSTEV